MAKVVFAPEAEDDLVEIAAFIARDKPDAARRWVRKIRESCEAFGTEEAAGEERPGFGVPGCRSFSVGNYVIFFRPAKAGIEVARVIHGSRDLRNLA